MTDSIFMLVGWGKYKFLVNIIYKEFIQIYSNLIVPGSHCLCNLLCVRSS